MGDLHLVLPALNLSTLNAGIFIMMQQVRLMMCWVAYEILVSAQGPLVLGFRLKGLGIRSLGPGLYNNKEF